MYKPTDIDFYDFIHSKIELDKLKTLTTTKWEKNLLTLKKSNSVSRELESGEVLEKGDIVILSTKSSCERFNKEKITVTLGIGLYCKELENALIGTKLGEQKEYEFSYREEKITAVVKTESGKRNKEAVIDDEFVRSHELEEKQFQSFEEYRKYWCDLNFQVDLQSQFIERCYMTIALDTAKKSNVATSKEIYDGVVKQYEMWKNEEIQQLNGDELAYYKMYFGKDIQTLEEGIKKYEQHIENNALMNTYSEELAKMDQITVTKDDFLKEMEEVAKAENMELSTVLESVTFEEYKKSIYQENLSKYILEILKQYIKKEGISYEL